MNCLDEARAAREELLAEIDDHSENVRWLRAELGAITRIRVARFRGGPERAFGLWVLAAFAIIVLLVLTVGAVG